MGRHATEKTLCALSHDILFYRSLFDVLRIRASLVHREVVVGVVGFLAELARVGELRGGDALALLILEARWVRNSSRTLSCWSGGTGIFIWGFCSWCLACR